MLRAGFETTRKEEAPRLGDEQNPGALGEASARQKAGIRVGNHQRRIHHRWRTDHRESAQLPEHSERGCETCYKRQTDGPQ